MVMGIMYQMGLVLRPLPPSTHDMRNPRTRCHPFKNVGVVFRVESEIFEHAVKI